MNNSDSSSIPTPEHSSASKPGWKTSEFWLSLASMLVSFIVAQGIVPEDSPWGQALAIVVTVLASLGYTASRSIVKRERIRASAQLNQELIGTAKQ